jgi:hypothetical protein
MEIEDRLSRLEGQNRLLKIVLAVSIGVIVAVGAVVALPFVKPASPPTTLTLHELQIVNDEGTIVGRLKADETSELPYLWMGDKAGNRRVMLQVASDQAGGGASLGLGLTAAPTPESRFFIRTYEGGAPSLMQENKADGSGWSWQQR